MEPAASQAFREQSVPSVTNAAPTRASEKCRQPGSPGAFELDEHQHRERPEGREQRHLGLLDHLVGEREDGRHHDRRARRVLERRHVHGKRSYDGPEGGAWHVGASRSGTFTRVAVNWLVRFLVAVALAAIGVTLVRSRSGSESARTPV
jgi:hypothetical protein